jgi:hypothetical protein
MQQALQAALLCREGVALQASAAVFAVHYYCQ